MNSPALKLVWVQSPIRRIENCDVADWVLSKFQEAEWQEMEQAFAHAADAATLIVQDQMDRAMNLYSK